MSYGATFRKMREDFGVTTLEVARELGHTDRLLSMIEDGRPIPTKTLAAKATRAVVEAHKKKTPGYPAVGAADREPSVINPNRQEGTNPMTIMVHEAANIAWRELPRDISVELDCGIAGCERYGKTHTLTWGDSFHHVAYEWRRDMGCQVTVDYYEDHQSDVSSLEANAWRVNGILSDDEKPLTPELVSEWMANYNSAVCLAAELNAGEASC